MRILLVEDDLELQKQLLRQLENMGFQVNVAHDGLEALFYIGEYTIDMAIIDLGLPKMGGIELIERLRKDGFGFPVLILTARTSWKDKVKGLDSGADDYLGKPFHTEELNARVKALLRRAKGHTQSRMTVGAIALDLSTSAVYVDDQEVDLTAFEFKVMEYFLMNPRKVISKSMLIDCLYDESEDRESNVVEVIIARLRKKLDPEGKIQPIETLRGRGYRFMNRHIEPNEK